MEDKQITGMVVHPTKVLAKITKGEWDALFSINIKRADGTIAKLFTDVEENEGYEKRFQDNVSVGTIVAVGSKLKGIQKGDVAILDYLVTGTNDSLVGYHKGHKTVAIPANTTYHTSDSTPQLDGRLTWKKGEFDQISPLLGVVRMKKLYARSPYVFLEYQNPAKLNIAASGVMAEVVDDVCVRRVIGASADSGYKDGDEVYLKEETLFSRQLDGKEISVVFEQDIMGLK